MRTDAFRRLRKKREASGRSGSFAVRRSIQAVACEQPPLSGWQQAKDGRRRRVAASPATEKARASRRFIGRAERRERRRLARWTRVGVPTEIDAGIFGSRELWETRGRDRVLLFLSGFVSSRASRIRSSSSERMPRYFWTGCVTRLRIVHIYSSNGNFSQVGLTS